MRVEAGTRTPNVHPARPPATKAGADQMVGPRNSLSCHSRSEDLDAAYAIRVWHEAVTGPGSITSHSRAYSSCLRS